MIFKNTQRIVENSLYYYIAGRGLQPRPKRFILYTTEVKTSE